MIEALLGVPVVVLLASLGMAAAGHALRALAGAVAPDEGVGYRLGAGWFAGMATFLAAWRVAAIALGSARLGALAAAAALAGAGWAGRESLASLARDTRAAPFAPGTWALSLLAPAYVAALWLNPIGASPTVFTSLGSLHAYRYHNVACVLIEGDRIPWLGQNYAQSLLAALPAFVGAVAPLWALTCWLGVAMIALGLLFQGLFRQLGLGAVAAGAGVVAVLAGNTALSLNHVLMIDSGSPLARCGYPDSLGSVGTLVLFFGWARLRSTPPALAAPLLLGVGGYWAMAAPHNLVLAAPIIAGLIAWGTWKRRPWATNAFPAALCLAAGGLLGAACGGMLSPADWRETGLPGILSAGGARGIAWQFELPHQVVSGFDLFYAPDSLPKPADFQSTAWAFETQLWAALRATFWPLLGFAAWWRLAPADAEPAPRPLLAVGLAFFALGAAIAGSIILSGLKWELSRFMMPGLTFGMVAGVLAANALAARHVRVRSALLILLVLLAGPPLIGAARGIGRNVLALPEPEASVEALGPRFEKLVSTRTFVFVKTPAPSTAPSATPRP